MDTPLPETGKNLRAKQVIVVRRDLNMRKGKMCAQVAHASSRGMAFAILAIKGMSDPTLTSPHIEAFLSWMTDGLSTKIVVGVDSKKELLELERIAEEAGLPTNLVKDAGLTEFKEPTYTALAIGPAWPDLIDPVTGELSLL